MPYFKNYQHEMLWYEETGIGMPLVFLHGWCMSSEVWCGQVKSLAHDFRVITTDLRGHGRSRDVSTRLDFETFASDLSDLFSHLNLRRVLLVGWSLGAQVALQAYCRLADRLAGMVLVAATPCFSASGDFLYGLMPNDVSGMRLKVERNLQRALDGFYGRMFAVGELEGHPEGAAIQKTLTIIDPPHCEAVQEALNSLAVADMRPLLVALQLPVLILNGEFDRICLPEASRYLAEQIAGAQRFVFNGCGHAPFMTKAEQFNQIIDQFARSTSE
jgi:pimeloyl-[acyl-carrier protein] methyl ester esterase